MVAVSSYAVDDAALWISTWLCCGSLIVGWLEFIATIFKAIAWPAVLVIAIVTFRAPVGELIRSLRSLKYREMELRFEQQLGKAEDDSEALPPVTASIGSPDRPMFTRDDAASDSSPEKRITHAWYSVRRAIWDLAQKSGIPSGSRLKPLTTINWLQTQEIIDVPTARILRNLKHLRDIGGSGYGLLSIDSERAERFEALASRVIGVLEASKSSPKKVD